MSDQQVLLHVYRDPVEGFDGFLAYAGSGRPLAAGGLRVQQGLTGETVMSLAAAMRGKEDILQLNVDGAKCGIDYDARAPGKHGAMRRFLRFLAPHLRSRLSLGPDMGTSFPEIESLARMEGVPSVKLAIADAQGLSHDDVLHRLALLDAPLGPLTLGERRAGHALAHAALAAWQRLDPTRPPTCALQGFGTLGRGAAATLLERGVTITTVADEHGCVHADRGLPIARMLAAPRGASPGEAAGTEVERGPREAVLATPADVLVLAACERALPTEAVGALQAPVVAVGANGGVEAAVAAALHRRGVVVVPDLVAGAGGSAAMDALFAPAAPPRPAEVLERVGRMARTLTVRVLERARLEGGTPAAVAATLAGETRLGPAERPYGLRTLAADVPGERREVVGGRGR